MFLDEKNPARLGKIRGLFSLCILEMSALLYTLVPFIGQTHAVVLTVGEIPMLLK